MTTEHGVVLDAGAFIALERRNRTMVVLAQRFIQAQIPLITSAGVVAQIWRGGTSNQVPISYLLKRTLVVDLTHARARTIGLVLGASGQSDPVDAHVVLLARERDWPVLTSDPDDLLSIDPTLTVERI